MKVLVGFDGSKSATEALHWAATFAAAHGDSLQVVRAWQYPASSVLPGPSRQPLLPPKEVEEALRDELDVAIDDQLPGRAGVGREVVRGSAAGTLVERTHAGDVRALVLGTRGLGGFSGLLLGSVTRACLEHSAAPVVVVPDGYRTGDGLRHVLVGLDGSDGSRGALRWACATAQAFDAALSAVTVFVPDQSELRPDVAAELRARTEADLERWCAGVDGGSSDRRRAVLEGDPRSALLDAVEHEDADLVVVGSRGLGPISRLLLGSVASALAHHSPVPVAVVPSGRRP
jgi:nucleotide-binding universal stress UspA family protein